jgi:hypothetical protein
MAGARWCMRRPPLNDMCDDLDLVVDRIHGSLSPHGGGALCERKTLSAQSFHYQVYH